MPLEHSALLFHAWLTPVQRHQASVRHTHTRPTDNDMKFCLHEFLCARGQAGLRTERGLPARRPSRRLPCRLTWRRQGRWPCCPRHPGRLSTAWITTALSWSPLPKTALTKTVSMTLCAGSSRHSLHAIGQECRRAALAQICMPSCYGHCCCKHLGETRAAPCFTIHW